MAQVAPSAAVGQGKARIELPRVGLAPPGPPRARVLLVCFYDPAGIPTVIETVAFLQKASRHDVTVLNLFEHRLDEGSLKLHPWTRLEAFEAVVIHNTVSYDPDNLARLDERLSCRLRDFGGVKVMLKQDENHRFREIARYIGATGFDVLFTCLPPEAVPLVYPPAVAGSPRIERMLTGYLTPSLRARAVPGEAQRPIDVGYRGSIQPLSFGRLAYEKRKIADDMSALLAGRGLQVDISSRWEDRLGGDEWLDFLSRCKATLGAESGASVFDLDGDLEERMARLQREHAVIAGERERTEAILAGLSDLEGNVRYGQVSPRHFEAAACGALQILYPGEYSGIFQPWRHYVPLERDYANLEEVLAILLDDARRQEIVDRARDEIAGDPAYWIEGFVARVDQCISDALQARGSRAELAAPVGKHLLAVGMDAPEGAHLPATGLVPHTLAIVDPAAAQGAPGPGGSIKLFVPRTDASPAFELAAIANADAPGAAAAVLAELLAAQAIARLPEHEFCELLGAPLDAPRNRAFRQELLDFGSEALLLAGHARRWRGVHVLLAGSDAGLAAAALVGASWRVPVAWAGPGEPAVASPSLEYEAQFRTGLRSRLLAAAGATVLGADPAQALERLVADAPAGALQVARERPGALVPGPAASRSAGESLRWAVYGCFRALWRVLPAGLRDTVKPFARRLMLRFF